MKTLTIVIPFHLDENLAYLRLCLNSIKAEIVSDIEIKIVLIADSESQPQVDPSVTLVYNKSLDTFASKLNYGFKAYPADYYLIASDDVIFRRGTIQAMIKAADSFPSIVNANSNCEDIGLVKNQYESKSGWHDNYRMFSKPTDEPYLIRPTRLKFYSTLIPHSVIEKVGYLDENYKNGWEDSDYCVRCRMEGITPIVTTAGYIFHFGGKTVDKMPHTTDNEQYYLDKWKDSPLKYLAYL